MDFLKKSFLYQLKLKLASRLSCNRKCSFCPRSDPEFVHKKEFISNKLHLKLCNELKAFNYRGTIRYSGFVEPLLDKNIFKFDKKMAKDKLKIAILNCNKWRCFKLSKIKKIIYTWFEQNSY